MNKNNASAVIGIVVGVLILVCCCCVLVFTTLSGAMLFLLAPGNGPSARVTPTPFSFTFNTPAPNPTPALSLTPVATPRPGETDTLTALAQAVVPTRDLLLLGQQLAGVPANIARTESDTPADHPLDTVLTFSASNTDTNEIFEVRARLVYKTDNVYFFAEDGLSVNERDVRNLVDTFQNQAYPTNREFFGEEWNPGVDGDPRLYILYARGLGFGVLGYYSSNDQYPSAAFSDSNAKEMFYINADLTRPGDRDLSDTLAHEFQHMIHWYQDSNEETWLNEGASVLAETLNGYSASGFDDSYLVDPSIQLNTWPEGSDSIPYYGGAFLFMTYFLDRFGEEAMKALVRHPENGLLAVDAVLREFNLTDPQTGQPITARDVFADWAVATHLGNSTIGDGRYAYIRYVPGKTRPTETFRQCPLAQADTVNQFGVKLYEIRCTGNYTLRFTGSQTVGLTPVEAYAGRYAFWSNRNDESMTSLTRAFDFSGLSTVTLNYAAWWHIEADYDYAYVQVSTDAGRTWQTVRTPHTTNRNPSGQNYGNGYNGESRTWIQESLDLSAYAGQAVLIRFQYITDPAVIQPGFLLDEVSLPELGYATGFEDDDGGWQAEGFVRVDNRLPQTYLVQLIVHHGGQTHVERLTLDAANTGSFPLSLNSGDRAVLVVSGATYFTTQPAAFEWTVD